MHITILIYMTWISVGSHAERLKYRKMNSGKRKCVRCKWATYWCYPTKYKTYSWMPELNI